MAANPGTPPVTPPPTGQPAGEPTSAGAPGAGQQQPASANEGFWTRFPNVPQEHRELLEPHLKGVQAHITRLEQQVAPFRGYNPQQIAGVAKFAQQFDANPVGTFLNLARQLQARGLVHDSLDLEALAAVVRGEDPDGGQGEPPDPQQQGYVDPRDEQIQELRSELDELKNGRQEDKRTAQERVENSMLNKTLTGLKKQLVEAGYKADVLTDPVLMGQLITHGGKVEAVVQGLTGLRTGILQGAIPTTKQPGEVELPNGPPTTRRPRGKDSSDPWKKAGAAAQQMLERQNRQG